MATATSPRRCRKPNAMPSPAIAAALALASAPTLASAMRRRPLPEGVEELLRVFARKEEAIAPLLSRLDLDRQLFMDCVDNYIQKVVLHPAGDPFRALAGTRSSSRDVLRRNMALLMEGLHPDKSGGAWKSAYAPRVLEAWREVSSGRAQAAASIDVSPSGVGGRPRRVAWIAHPVPAAPAKRRTWRLGLALLGVVVALAYGWRSVEASLVAMTESLAP